LQNETSNDAMFMGMQRAYDSSELYRDLIGALIKHELGGSISDVPILLNPSEPLDSIREPANKRVGLQVVLGGGIAGPFSNASGDKIRAYFGLRGYLTLNRLNQLVSPDACIGELGILACRLPVDSHLDSDILYVSTSDLMKTSEFLDSLENLGAKRVGIEDGLETLLEHVKGANLVISDGVIGLALADSFGVPNVWHRTSKSDSNAFQVMDYLSGVRRPLHQWLNFIPTEKRVVEKRARVASQNLIGCQGQRLLDRLDEILKVQASFVPTEVLESPVQLLDGPVNASFFDDGIQAGKVEIEYEYLGSQENRQILVSMDLASNLGTPIQDIEKLPGLGKSSRSDIGFFKYINLMSGIEKTEVLVDLPDGIRCRGIRVLRWSDKNSEIRIRKITLLKYL